MPRIIVLLSLCMVSCLIGCEAQPAKPPTSSAPPPTAADAAKLDAPSEQTERAAPEKAAGEITVAMIDAEGFEAAVAKHKGQVVLVDCWATWCVPCIKGFPDTVALSKRHVADGLAVISLSFDDPEDEETAPKVLEFLQKHEATFENYISQVDLEQGGVEAFGIEGGSLPHYKLYGRSGQLLMTFSNSDPDQEFSHAMLVAAVEDALK